MNNDFVVNSTVLEMMRRMAYLPGTGLGRSQQGVAELPNFPIHKGRFGLGYKPIGKEKKVCGYVYDKNYVVYFVKGGANRPYHGHPEPFVNTIDGEFYPGFEIFIDDVWGSEDEKEKV